MLSKVTIAAASTFMLSALLLAMPALNGNVSVLSANPDPTVETPAANAVDANANTAVPPDGNASVEAPAETNANSVPSSDSNANSAPAANTTAPAESETPANN